MNTEKVAIYVDGSNLYHSLKENSGRADIDFQKLGQKLAAGRHLVRTYYYNAPVDQTKEPERYRRQQRFFSQLKRTPYFEFRPGRLIYRNWPQESPYEKGLDVKLATDLLVHCFNDNCDTVILVSHDTDFADALQAAKDHGQHVEVALFGAAWTSQRLRDVADRVISVDSNFLAGCWR